MAKMQGDLHLVVPQRFFTHGQNAMGDRHVYAARTRSIPKAILDRFECTSWPLVSTARASAAVPRGVRLDVGAKMRGMWR